MCVGDKFVNLSFFLFSPGPPVFTVLPENKIAEKGSVNVTFKCNASSNPSPTLAWFKDGIAINQNYTNVLLSENKQIITIREVQRSDAGFYVCNATNKIKSVSMSAYLDVQCKYNFSENLFQFSYFMTFIDKETGDFHNKTAITSER
jgi:hypothetical protein